MNHSAGRCRHCFHAANAAHGREDAEHRPGGLMEKLPGNDIDRVSPETLRDVVEAFTGKIVPNAKATIGLAHDVDGDADFSFS